MNEIAKKRAVGGGVLVLALLAGTMGRGEEWRYDFPTMDSLESTWGEGCDNGVAHVLTDEGLEVRPAQLAPPHAYVHHLGRKLEGDISMRVQARSVGPGRLWFAAHLSECGSTYTIGYNSEHGVVSLNIYNNGEFLSQWRAGIEAPPDRDRYLNLQLDIRKSGLEVWAWWEGENTPCEPQIRETDMTHGEGWVGIGYSSDGYVDPISRELSYGLFRFVWICEGADCDVPECIPGGDGFVRGDCNDDGEVEITDAIFALRSLFVGEGSPTCGDACDSNDDGVVNLADAIYLLNYLFLGGPAPARPFPSCGPDTTEDALGCQSFEECE